MLKTLAHAIEPIAKQRKSIRTDMPIMFEQTPPVFLKAHPMLDTPEKRQAFLSGYQARDIETDHQDRKI
ncbi:hypothetical protein ACU8OK_25640 (plasmid) [Rhizobium leguminosarum]